MINDPNNLYYLTENDVSSLRKLVAGSKAFSTKQNILSGFSGPAVILYGRVATTWDYGDDTVSVVPVYFDDELDRDNATAIEVYITNYGTPDFYENSLASGNIVPFLPFGGEDAYGVSGVLASRYPEDRVDPFAPVYNADGTIDIVNGAVYLGDDAVFSIVTGLTSQSLSSNIKFYFEIECNCPANESAAFTYNVSGTLLSTSGAWPSHYNETPINGDLTITVFVGEILDGQYYQYVWGDFYYQYPLQPHFHEDIRPSTDPTEHYFLGVEDINSIATLADAECFFLGRYGTKKKRAGMLYETGDNSEIRWGGDTDTPDVLTDLSYEASTCALQATTRAFDVQKGLIKSVAAGVTSDVWICCCASPSPELWENEATTNTYGLTRGISRGKQYIYLAEATVWQKYKLIGRTTVADDPLMHFDHVVANPTSFAQLKGPYMSETFTGIDSDVGEVDDAHWKIKYDFLTKDGVVTIAGGILTAAVDQGNPKSIIIQSQAVIDSAINFTLDVNYDITNPGSTGGPSQSASLIGPTGQVEVQIGTGSPGMYDVDGTRIDETAYFTGIFRLVRTGTTLEYFYWDGAAFQSAGTKTHTGDIDAETIWFRNFSRNTTQNFTVDWWDISMTPDVQITAVGKTAV
jgi:hypothetical protein